MNDFRKDDSVLSLRFGIGSYVTMFVLALVLLSLSSITVLQARDQSRSNSCSDNLRQIGLALHDYHDAFKQLPPASGGTKGLSPKTSNQSRLSGFAAILPFIEQQPAWELLSNPTDGFPRMGPAPSCDPKSYRLWAHQIDVLVCPEEVAPKKEYGIRSYVMNYGDGVFCVGRLIAETPEEMQLQRAVNRGAFIPNRPLGFRDFLDGTSHTILISETKVGVNNRDPGAWVARDVDGLVESPKLVLTTIGEDSAYKANQPVWPVGKGSRWAEGTFMVNGFTTVLPPNSPSATLPKDPESGCLSASSHHVDGVHVLMAGGEILFVSNSIDTGNLQSPSVTLKNNPGQRSPYGVWGALGTRASKELIPSQREAAFETIGR